MNRIYNCCFCSMPDCICRNSSSKDNCLLDKHKTGEDIVRISLEPSSNHTIVIEVKQI
jgi:hypothetical protein